MHQRHATVSKVVRRLALLVAVCLGGHALAQDTLSDEEIRNRTIVREQTRAAQMEAEAVARSAMARFERRVTDADLQLKELDEARKRFDGRLASLLHDDTGRRIAVQNHQAGLVIMDWIDWPLFRDADFAEQRGFTDEMLKFLAARRERPDVPFAVSPEQQEKIDDAYLWARDRSARLAERLAWIDDAVRSVDAEQPVEGVASLAEVIESFRKARRDLWASAAAVGIERAREEAEPQMTEAARVAELERLLQETEQRLREARQQMEIDRMRFDSTLRMREAEAIKAAGEAETARKNLLAENEHIQRLEDANRDLRKALSEAEARQIRDDARRVELTQRAQSPAVRRDLAPFLARGTWQPNQRARQQNAGMPGPISFSALVEVGALEQTPQGLMQLLAVANRQGCAGANNLIHWHQNNRHFDQERPKWGYPRQFRALSMNDREEVARIQSILIELGPTLVELEMLAP